jgi:hypothetical protein
MLEALNALAALAGNTVVAAATTDVWEAARRKFTRLLGRTASAPGAALTRPAGRTPRHTGWLR